METLPLEPTVEAAKAPCDGLTISPPELGSSDLKQLSPEKISPEATSKEEQENQKVENQHDGKVDEVLSPAHSGGPKSVTETTPEESAVSKKRVEEELHKGSGQEPPKAKKQKAAKEEKPLVENQAPDLLDMEAWCQQAPSRTYKIYKGNLFDI